VSAPPLIILGVRRSGTTLFRVMLDRHPEVAIPDESYFVPQLADRHRGAIDVEGFVDDLRRLPTLGEWGVSADEVRARLRPGMPVGEAIAAVYEAYAAQRGKSRWGDKTPLYMQYLGLLDRLFPDAVYLHLVRDGRDAAVSFRQLPAGIVTDSAGLHTFAAHVTGAEIGIETGWRSAVASVIRNDTTDSALLRPFTFL